MKHRHNHIALLLIAIFVTAFVFALYVYMQYAVDSSLSRALAARDSVIHEQTSKDEKKTLSTLYDDTAKRRSSLGSYFVDDGQKVQFIERVESFGPSTQSQVSLSGIVADDLSASPPGTVGRISMHVDATGSWSSVMRVLGLAENLPYKSSVTSVRLDFSGSEEGKESRRQWHISFVLETASIKRAQ